MPQHIRNLRNRCTIPMETVAVSNHGIPPVERVCLWSFLVTQSLALGFQAKERNQQGRKSAVSISFKLMHHSLAFLYLCQFTGKGPGKKACSLCKEMWYYVKGLCRG